MKKLFSCLIPIFFFASLSLQGQTCTPEASLRSEIQDLADWAANELQGCCSTFGGRNLVARVIYDPDSDGRCQTRVSQLTNSLIITMQAEWTGSMSGTRYWIKGKLLVNLNTGVKEWQKIADSGGFSPGCSRGCIQ